MRKIPCQSCRNKHFGVNNYGSPGQWLVFDTVVICDTCRLAVIQYWTDVLGFNLASHVFLDEFMGMESTRTVKILLDN